MANHTPQPGVDDAGLPDTSGSTPASTGVEQTALDVPQGEPITLELREEELVADKRAVLLGFIRLRRHLVTEMRTIEVAVTREELTLERLPSDAASGPHEAEPKGAELLVDSLAEQLRSLQPGQTVRVPLVDEEVLVQKRPIVTRELVIGKRVVDDVRELSATVRRQDARVTFEAAPHVDATSSRSSAAGSVSQQHAAGPPTGRDQNQPQTIELREEELRLRTETTEAGVVHVHTGVLLERGSVTVHLAHEEIVAEEHSVDAYPSERPLLDREQVIDIPEYGEHADLRKQPVVVEEITVNVDTVQENRRVNATVLHEEATVTVEGSPQIATDVLSPRPPRT